MSGAAQGNAAQGIAPANGKLGVMIPGMGAVATTLIAGVEAVRRGLAQPVGSLTQMDTLKLGDEAVPVKEAVQIGRAHV